MNKRWVVLGIPAVFLACGGPPQEETAVDGELPPAVRVHATTHPLAYFAERIGGERVEVTLPVLPGRDPAAWTPEPAEILAFQDADLILMNGAEYEGWRETATLPASRLVDTSADFEESLIYVEDAITHSHGPEGEHTHGEMASVTWLDLSLAARQAEAIRDALIARDPDGASGFHDRFDELVAKLRELDESLEAALARFQGDRFLSATPSYHYFARRYGVEVEALRFDVEDPMGHDFWHDLEHALSHGAVSVMLWEEEPPAGVRDRLADLGIESLVVDPAANPRLGRDFAAAMVENRRRIEGFDGR